MNLTYIITTATIAIILICGLWFSLQKKQKKSASTDATYPFTARQFLTPREHNFYKELKPIADYHNCVIMAKVRLADLAEVEKGFNNSEYYTHFGKIRSKHIDFVLCNQNTINPKIIIEVDDKSHSRADRIKRDEFVNTLFKTIGLPIIHVQNTQELEPKIREILQPKIEVN